MGLSLKESRKQIIRCAHLKCYSLTKHFETNSRFCFIVRHKLFCWLVCLSQCSSPLLEKLLSVLSPSNSFPSGTFKLRIERSVSSHEDSFVWTKGSLLSVRDYYLYSASIINILIISPTFLHKRRWCSLCHYKRANVVIKCCNVVIKACTKLLGVGGVGGWGACLAFTCLLVVGTLCLRCIPVCKLFNK